MTDLRPDARRVRDTGANMTSPRTRPRPTGSEAERDALDAMHATPSAPRPATATGQPAPDASGSPPPGEKPPAKLPRPIPAGHAIAIVMGALLFMMIFNSKSMVHAGEGMRAGTTRDLVLGVAKPVNSAAHTLYLDRPREWLGKLFGTEAAPTGPSQLTELPPSAGDDRPLGSGGKPVPGPSAAPSGGPSAAPKPSAPVVAPLRTPTAAEPLKLLVAGDSMTEFMGPSLYRAAGTKVTGATETKYGTGLVRPDFFDWALYAQQLVKGQNPEAVVVMMGGNDGQGITLANGQVLRDGTQEWAKEYRRRIEVVMRIFSNGGKTRVYWVSMPVPRSQQLAVDYQLIDTGIKDAAAAVPGATYIDIAGPLSNNGQYSDYIQVDGRTILARTRDGIHMSQDGANYAASLILQTLNKDWKLTP